MNNFNLETYNEEASKRGLPLLKAKSKDKKQNHFSIESYNEEASKRGLPLLKARPERLVDKIADIRNNINAGINRNLDVVNSLGTDITQGIADMGTGAYNLLSKLIPGLKPTAPPNIEKGLPESVQSGLSPISNNINTLINRNLDMVNSFGTGVTQNIADMGTGAYNLLSRLIPGLKPTAPPNIEKGLPESVQSGLSPTLESVGEFANPVSWMAPELDVGSAVGLGGAGAGFLSKLASRGLSGAATGGAYGVLLSPLHQGIGATVGGLTGAGLSSLLGVPGDAIGSIVGKLRRRSLESGSLRTPEEVSETIQKIQSLYKGRKLPINLGDLIKSPFLSTLYHDNLSAIPFSGARQKGQQVLDMAKTHAKNIINMLKHDVDPAKVDSYLLDKLKANYKSIRKSISKKYDNIYERAKNLGLSAVPENTISVAKDLLKKYSKPEMEDLLNPETIKSLKRATGIKTALDKKNSFKIIVSPEIEKERAKVPESTFETLRNNISAYGKKSRRANTQGERTISSVYNELQSATRNDLEGTINESGDENLKDDLKKANKLYKEHQAPYQSTEMNKLRYLKKSPDNIHNVLLKGDNLPIVGHLEDKDKDILAYKKLYKSLEKEGINKEITNPFKLVRHYDSLTPKQQDALFNSRPVREEFNKLRVLTKASKEAALKEDRPYTGGRLVGKTLQYLPAILGGGAVFAHGLMPKLAAILGATSVSGGARGLTSALTSDWLRNAYTSGELPKFLSSRIPAHLLSRLTNISLGQYLGDKK